MVLRNKLTIWTAVFATALWFLEGAFADDCSEAIASAEKEVSQYQSCTVDTDCKHLNSGWLSMTAVNEGSLAYALALSGKLDSVCGTRQSHDAFYSQYGIKIACESQQCVVREINSEEKRQQLYRDSLSTLEEQVVDAP
jgi:hypothetical protein